MQAGRLSGGGRGGRGVKFMAPALLWFRGEPPFAHHPPTPHPGIAHFGIGRKRGMWQVSEGGGRAREAAGAAWGPGGPRRSQRRCRNAAAAAGSRPPGPAQRGQRRRCRWSSVGDHGFRLHSGQSFPGTPGLPGSRTGTRPPSAPWLASGSAASSPSGRCPPHLRTASAPARC